VELVVKLILKVLVDWIAAHPEAPLSQYLLKTQGTHTGARRMNRLQRLTSAVTFLLWGCLFLGLWVATGYVTFQLKVLSPENTLVQSIRFAAAFLAGGGFLGGVYLLVRVVF